MFDKGKDILRNTLLGRSTSEKASIIRGIMGSGESVPLLGEELLMAQNSLKTIANVGSPIIPNAPISRLFQSGRLNPEDELKGIRKLEGSLCLIPNIEPSREIGKEMQPSKSGSARHTEANQMDHTEREDMLCTKDANDKEMRIPNEQRIRIPEEIIIRIK